MNELHLFAGAGGGILGSKLLGHRTVCAVEIEKYPRKVLLQRQRDGILPWFPIWDDICTFDGTPWRGIVDIIAGGFPCQDISSAGKGAGIEGERSGLWGQMARVVGEVRPRFVFVENSPMLTSRGLYRVLGDLAELGYNARWCVLGADDVGAPHRRKRIWILAYPKHSGRVETENTREYTGIQPESTSRSKLLQHEPKRDCGLRETTNKTDKNDSNSNMLGCFHKQSKIDSAKTGYDAQCELGTAMRENAGKDVAGTLCKRGSCRESRRQNAMDADTSCEERVQNKKGISWWKSDPAELPDTDSIGQIQRKPGPRQREGLFEDGGSSTICEEYDCIRVESNQWPVESQLGRVAHGVADRVDRLKAIGNGQVPAVVATAWTILSDGLV